MRILALLLTALAVYVWWHPLPLISQSLALIALAVACMAIRSYMKRAEVVRRKLAELENVVRPLRSCCETDPEGGHRGTCEHSMMRGGNWDEQS